MSNIQYYGCYSASMASIHGYMVYEDPNGNEVKATLIHTEPGPNCGNYHNWNDARYVGPVTKYVRKVKGSNTEELFKRY